MPRIISSDESVVMGLRFFVEAAKEIGRILYSDGRRGSYEYMTELPSHPFGLVIPHRGSFGRWKDVGFAADPGITDASVKTFSAYVLDRLTYEAPACHVRYMRVILAEFDPKQRNNHDVFFEIGIGDDVFMCGGCTDCSGAGSSGKERLEGLFDVLSRVTGVGVQRVTIPFEQADRARRALKNNLEVANR